MVVSNLIVPIKLLCSLDAPGAFTDLNREAGTSFIRGDDIQFDLAIGYEGQVITSTAGNDEGFPIISYINSITLQIFQSRNDTNPPMLSATTSTINTALTQADWTNIATPFFHASIVIPNSQTAIPLNGAPSQNYWLRITAQTRDATPKTVTILDGPITVFDGPVSAASPPPLGGFRFYTINGVVVPQLLDPTTGLYHTLSLLNDSGTFTVQLSDQGY